VVSIDSKLSSLLFPIEKTFNFFLFKPITLYFNENFGIGAKYDFGEEAELVARTLGKDGYLILDQKAPHTPVKQKQILKSNSEKDSYPYPLFLTA
jgi:hypothetical protein